MMLTPLNNNKERNKYLNETTFMKMFFGIISIQGVFLVLYSIDMKENKNFGFFFKLGGFYQEVVLFLR